jgi:hypothetical protein
VVTNGPIVLPPDDMRVWSPGGMILTGGNRRTWRKTCPSATLFTINPTWTDPGTNLGLRSQRLATNCLSHSTASGSLLMFRIVIWDVLPCKIIVDNYFTRQYIPEDNSEHHIRRCENLKSHMFLTQFKWLSYCKCYRLSVLTIFSIHDMLDQELKV